MNSNTWSHPKQSDSAERKTKEQSKLWGTLENRSWGSACVVLNIGGGGVTFCCTCTIVSCYINKGYLTPIRHHVTIAVSEAVDYEFMDDNTITSSSACTFVFSPALPRLGSPRHMRRIVAGEWSRTAIFTDLDCGGSRFCPAQRRR